MILDHDLGNSHKRDNVWCIIICHTLGINKTSASNFSLQWLELSAMTNGADARLSSSHSLITDHVRGEFKTEPWTHLYLSSYLPFRVCLSWCASLPNEAAIKRQHTKHSGTSVYTLQSQFHASRYLRTSLPICMSIINFISHDWERLQYVHVRRSYVKSRMERS